MSPRSRTLAIYLLTLAIFGGGLAYTVVRIQDWHTRGWTGLNYFPDVSSTKKQKTTAQQFGAVSGELVMIYGGTPAEGRILPTDRIVAVNGVPIGNLPELRRLESELTFGGEVRYRIQRAGK